jgi:GxxExxY protein
LNHFFFSKDLMENETLKQWERTLIECANRVFADLGSGYSESIYHSAMEVEFRHRGIHYETKVVIPIKYLHKNVGFGIADLIVCDDDGNNIAIIELKAVTYAPRAQERAQVATYLRSRPDVHFGLLINFRQPTSSACADSIDTCRVEHSARRPLFHSEKETDCDNPNEDHRECESI